jgi:hypothetical protein
MKRKRRGIDGRRAGGVGRPEEVGHVRMASSSWAWPSGLGCWLRECETAGLGAGGGRAARAEAERRRGGMEVEAERRWRWRRRRSGTGAGGGGAERAPMPTESIGGRWGGIGVRVFGFYWAFDVGPVDY